MQKRAYLFVMLIALISGCNGKKNESVSPRHTVAKDGTIKTTGDRAEASNQPSQLGEMPQPASSAPDLATTLAVGEKVYRSTCSICHKSGLNGAPRVGSKKDWEARIAQGKEVLYNHAINGYRGSKGSMPSRGSNPRLSEAEVKAAVDYIVEHAIPSWSVE